jgi:fluoride exporter
MTVLLVALGAAVGAPLRYLVGHRLNGGFPWGTLAVNVAGSLLLGALAGSGTTPAGVTAAVGTGFCGALTTYSTFGWETLLLPSRRAVTYVLVSTAVGLGAAALGWWLGAGH